MVREVKDRGDFSNISVQFLDIFRMCFDPLAGRVYGDHSSNGSNTSRNWRKLLRRIRIGCDHSYTLFDFSKHMFSIAMPHRCRRTFDCFEKFSIGEIFERLGFQKQRFGLKQYGVVLPLTYAMANCAPMLEDARTSFEDTKR